MSWYKSYKLVTEGDRYIVEICLNQNASELSKELITNFQGKILDLDQQINKLIDEKFSDVKVYSVKLMLGALVVGTLSLVPHAKAQAAEINIPAQQGISQSNSINTINTTGVVTASALNMRTGLSTSYSIMHILWKGNRVNVIGDTSDWYEIKLSDNRTGWVSKSYITLDNQANYRQEKVDEVINYAESFEGTPYVYGGNSPSDGGFDCSGYVQYVFDHFGYNLNRISRDQALNGTYVPRADVQPGDLIFYSLEGNGFISHVGIYLGNGLMIHSPTTGETVQISNVATIYWRSHYVTARRIIQ